MNEQTMKPADMLAQVNAAISAVLVGGQSYKMGSRQLTRADLPTLKAMRAELEAQISADQPCHLLDHTVVAFFDGR